MLKIEYPHHGFKIKKETGKEFIFDEVRKKWLRLTPEEWVRQNFIQYLIQIKNYPASLIAVEKEIELGELKKRCDIVLYKSSKPWMIVECKEMNVPLTDSVIEQILRYNITLDVRFLVVTNGMQTLAVQTFAGTTQKLDELPAWDDYEG